MTAALARDAWHLVFDGDCGFCTLWARRLERWSRGRLRIVAAQDTAGLAHLPPLDPAALMEAMHVVSPGGDVSAGAAAAPHLLRLLPGGAVPAALFAVPGVPRLAATCYRWVARNRYRLPGASAACAVER